MSLNVKIFGVLKNIFFTVGGLLAYIFVMHCRCNICCKLTNYSAIT